MPSPLTPLVGQVKKLIDEERHLKLNQITIRDKDHWELYQLDRECGNRHASIPLA